MSQVHLHRLNIVPVLQGKDGEGAAQIVYSCVRCTDFLRELLKVQVDPLFGSTVNKDVFAANSWYFRNALVRAS